MSGKMVALHGSEVQHKVKPTMLGASSPNEAITVTVKLKSKATSIDLENPVTHAQFGGVYGADPAAVKRVVDYSQSHGLVVLEANAAKRRVVLHGSITQFEKAFGVELQQFELGGNVFRGHAGNVHVPEDIIEDVEAVLGLGNRKISKPHFQIKKNDPTLRKNFLNTLPHTAQPVPMNPGQVGELYNFPAGLNGGDQTVAILEFGGGYTTSDMQTYFQSQGVTRPTIVDVSVQGATNSPGSDADGEVELDIQIVGCIAPKARIVVYFCNNDSQGFSTGITDAAHDSVNKASVISISWGGPESTWSPTEIAAVNNAIRDAGLLGITVTVAAGDAGSNDGIMDGLAHCDFPASSPYALSCGGTQLIGNGAIISSETVWNDAPDSAGGGGISHIFPVPSYQAAVNKEPSANTPPYHGRGVPDISANADPNSGYNVLIDGQPSVVGGTSAVAPLWAGLIACLNQALRKRVGFINPKLYATPHIFRQVTAVGNNGHYTATPGSKWNPASGLGSIIGEALFIALK